MKVFRVETRNGMGPYTNEVYNKVEFDYYDAPSYVDTDYRRHPAPREDGLYGVMDDEYFGFEYEVQCFRWFFVEPDDAQKLEDLGLVVSTYEVPDRSVRTGRRQAVFVRSVADIVDTRTPTQFMADNGR